MGAAEIKEIILRKVKTSERAMHKKQKFLTRMKKIIPNYFRDACGVILLGADNR